MTRFSMLLLLLAGLPGCAYRPYLVASPNLLRHHDPEHYFAECPADCQSPLMEVLYVTDRSVEETPEGLKYGYGRARRLGFGMAGVTLSPKTTWKELIRESSKSDRQHEFVLKSESVKEVGHFDPMLHRLEMCQQGFKLCADARADLDRQQKLFHETLRKRLSESARKDVYIFVHGVNNTFEDAVFTSAQVWHFMGRVGVPITYTWPAGFGGIRGYAYDRESGEFTVFHLKNFLRIVAACPEVERIHLIAHSRGTDVTISALRELHVGYLAAGKSTQQMLKLENLVLAAPDLDEDVFMQRFIAENLVQAARRTTIYVSKQDKAIEVADIIFGSRKRLGQLGPRDFSAKARHMLSLMPNLQFVECQVSRFSNSHNYIFAHPAALSDLILVLRDRRDPGTENGRPLRQPVDGIWELTNEYWLDHPREKEKEGEIRQVGK